MRKTKTFISVIALVIFSFISCKHDSNVDPKIVDVTANIDDATTWETGKIYVIKKADLFVNNELTIQPGVVIKFHPALGSGLMLGGSGKIIANGTSDSKIVFTSYKDDVHGGDNNYDENATSPAVGDWGTINLNGISGSVFQYCEFMFSGKNKCSALEISASASATVKNCIFRNNDGLYNEGGALNASASGESTIIEDNIFYNNNIPLSIAAKYNLGNSNTFHNPDNASEKNKYCAIFVSGSSIDNPISWSEDEVAYFLKHNGDFVVNSTLTLGDNVVIKALGEYADIFLMNGESSIINFNGSGVYFTSYKDDAHGGDSNGDGNTTSPADADWFGVVDGSFVSYTWSNILYDGV
ncbi:MAG TPA: hypothetical protein PKK00_06320 [Bacteroidales bacterium]|nr:hypothetical protein [Bacteroidales bacterium]HPS16904.1 hypothetical protein [Bacteroidales bacterium]